MQSAGVGLQVATQMRGAVCCDIALSGGDDDDPVLDPEEPDCVEVPDDDPLEAEPDPAAEGVVDFFGGAVLLDFLAAGAVAAGLFTAGFETMRDVPFAAGFFALDFGATFVGRAAVRLAADFGALAAAVEVPLVFDSAAVALPAACDPPPACIVVDDISLLNGERTVTLVERAESVPEGPPCCEIGVAANPASAPMPRPARTAASETGSRIELNDDRINCSSTKVRTPHRNWTRPRLDRRSSLGTPTPFAMRNARRAATSFAAPATRCFESHQSAEQVETRDERKDSLKSGATRTEGPRRR